MNRCTDNDNILTFRTLENTRKHTRKHTKPSSNFKDISPWSHIFSSIISVFIKNLSLLMLHPSKCFLLDLKQKILKCTGTKIYNKTFNLVQSNCDGFWFPVVLSSPRQTIFCKGEDFLNACCIWGFRFAISTNNEQINFLLCNISVLWTAYNGISPRQGLLMLLGISRTKMCKSCNCCRHYIKIAL